MSHNGTLNISRDEAGEGTRVLVLKNGGSDMAGGEGQGVAQLSRASSLSNGTSAQHGGSISDSEGMGNCDGDNVMNGILRSPEDDVDPSSDLGADLQHIEEWLKTRSDSLSSFDFDHEIKSSEVDVNDFLNLKGSAQFQVTGQEGSEGSGSSSVMLNQFSFSEEGLVGSSGSRRSSFTKRLETLMQVDKGLFEELLLTDPNRRQGNRKVESLPSLTGDDRGLFEELLLPGAHEEWARQAQELLLAVTSEKKDGAGLPSQEGTGEAESPLHEAMECSVPVSSPQANAAAAGSGGHGASDDLDLMVRSIQPIKLMSPQEIENMASRPLGFDEAPVKSGSQRSGGSVHSSLEEDFIFLPFGRQEVDDGAAMPPDLLASPSNEIDSKLSSILAMDASNDTLEIPGADTDTLEGLSKVAPRLERSVSPGTFLVKLEPQDKESLGKAASASLTSSQSVAATMPPPQTVLATTPPLQPQQQQLQPQQSLQQVQQLPLQQPVTIAATTAVTTSFQALPLLNIGSGLVSKTTTPLLATTVTATCSATTTTTTLTSAIATTTTSTTFSSSSLCSSSTTTSSGIAPKKLLKIPGGSTRREFKKLPVGVVQLRIGLPVTSTSATPTTTPLPITTATSATTTRPALIFRPLITSQPALSQTSQARSQRVSAPKEGSALSFAPVKMIPVHHKPGTANVTITVDRRANLTSVSIVSSNGEHTVFKINTCDLVRAVSSIREPHLDPLGLTPQQLLRSAHTAHRLIQEVHQHGAVRSAKGSAKESVSGPQNFEINQAFQEVKAPISRSQQGQLALLRQAVSSSTTSTIQSGSARIVTSSTSSAGVRPTIIGTSPLLTTVPTPGPVIIPASVASTMNGTVLTTVKGAVSGLAPQKVSGESTPSLRPEPKPPCLAQTAIPDKSHAVKTEGVGVSLRPGAPPTMVSVPSVLDKLSASSLVSPDLLQTSAQSPSSSANHQSDEDVNEENLDISTVSDEVANKALEELGIHIDLLQCEPSPQGGKRWLCSIKGCSKHFPKLSSLKVHLLSHNGIRPYKCNYENCDWAFYTWYKLKRHIETHLKRRDFVCTENNCNRRFTTVYNLNTHLRLHQRPKSWLCALPECSQAYHTRRELEVHMKTHKDVEAPYKCGVDGCSKSYFTPNSLTSHMRSHHKEEELRCQWTGCGKKFDKPCRLKAHMRVHTGQRPFACTYEGCNWSFQSASKLSRHQRKHTNDRKFTCHICQKSFLRSEHLKGHLLIHTGVRNFQCPIEHCNAKFTAKSSLYVHLKKHEGKAKENNNKVTYHCPIDTCDKNYNSKHNLRQHMLKEHTILTTDNNRLDYLTLLGDKDLMVDQLLPLTTGGSSSSPSSSSSVVLESGGPSSILSASPSSDPHATLLSSIELINGDIDSNNIPPIIVMEGKGGAEAIDSIDVSMADSLMGGNGCSSGTEVDAMDISSIPKDSLEDVATSGGGSARTDVIADIIRSQRAKRRKQFSLAKKLAGMGSRNTASAVMPVSSHLQSTLLQDDGVGGELYQETLMGHDLLSDPTTDPQSTINLRDLE
ncbi:serine-rich adhesin for platelets-like isoform X2 [Scylla paramamosain]|uniref:serine-rich adhesin for platelets-like isoform X2 n=1 Tax=Scylla paramamosain TaxID=85552 RepID=UPI00308338BC